MTAERLGEGNAGSPERPPTPSWIEPSVYDIFEPDGTYLGEVRVPKGTRVMIARRDSTWGTRQGDAGEVYVVRLRIERAADGA